MCKTRPKLYKVCICIFSLILFGHISYASEPESSSILQDVVTALDNRTCQYQEERRLEDMLVDVEGNQKFIKVTMKQSSCGAQKDAKENYFTPSGFFRFEKYIISAIHFYYASSDDIKYIVWVDKTGHIQRIEKHIPIHSIKKDSKKRTETFEDEIDYYDKLGVLTNRLVSTTHVDHNRFDARYTTILLNQKGDIITTHSGDFNYDDFAPDRRESHNH